MNNNMNIFRRFFLGVGILSVMAAAADAQTFRKFGLKARDLVPVGWTFSESWGDLNRDGAADLLILAAPYDDSKASEPILWFLSTIPPARSRPWLRMPRAWSRRLGRICLTADSSPAWAKALCNNRKRRAEKIFLYGVFGCMGYVVYSS